MIAVASGSNGVTNMRIVLLSWEFPPRLVGGLSRHVEGISRELTKLGHEVHIVTLDFPGSLPLEQRGSLYIHRVPVEVPATTFHTWVLLFNHFFEKKVGQIAHAYGKPDVVHVHDWLTVPAGVACKHLLRTPLVMTFHSTEVARSSGSGSLESSLVHGLEWWGSFEASRLIAVSGWMKEHVTQTFKLPPEKVDVIHNGLDLSMFAAVNDIASTRANLHLEPDDLLVTTIGRMTAQKGFDDLLRAFPLVLQSVPRAKLVLIGDGYMRSELELLAKTEGIANKTLFTGFIDDKRLVDALKSSNAVVIPSRFEPFGITALEAMAAGAPLVVSRVGGLAEIVDDRVDGLEVEPQNSRSIAEGLVRVLNDPSMAAQLAARAGEKVKSYTWGSAAEATLRVYGHAVSDARYG